MQLGCHHSNSVRLIYLIGALGTIIEWYDFAIYGHLAPIFAHLFFAGKDRWLSLLLVYGIFFISYLARPLGGLLSGYIGDHLGRKPALLLSIAIMTISMVAMMLLPTWQTIGVVAPLLLLIFRVMQGLSAGGETTGSFIYVLESVNRKRHGLCGSAIWAMTFVGTLLASGLAALLTHALSQAQMFAWGWRLAYLIGAIAGITIFFLRAMMPESLEFAQAKYKVIAKANKGVHLAPLKEAILYYKRTIFLTAILSSLPAAVVYFTVIYFPQYIHHYFNVSFSAALGLNTVILLVVTVAMILFGWLSDHIGQRKMLTFSALCFVLFSYPILVLVTTKVWHIIALTPLLFIVLIAIYEGSLPAVIVRLAPLRVRYTVFSLGFNVSFAIFGGSAPLLCSQLAHWSPNHLAPAFYFIVLALFSLWALFLLRHNKGTLLDKSADNA
ncbi:MAG: MHS family MFS transporter [Gammaproteobacteria bacterium]|nr:MHS family MFS transporter [Gammaproteobacteria bacterium]